LSELLTGLDFERGVASAQHGDVAQVNLLVRDIYGGDYKLPSGSSLPGSLTASFFGKAKKGASAGSLALALVMMVTQNLATIVELQARLHGLETIVFTGNFLRKNPVAMRTIAHSLRRISAQSGQEKEAFFLKHEGHFGAIGSFLLNTEGGEAGLKQSQRVPSGARQRRGERRLAFAGGVVVGLLCSFLPLLWSLAPPSEAVWEALR